MRKKQGCICGVEGLIKARTKWWHKEVQETAAAGVESCFVTGKAYFLPENWNACDHKNITNTVLYKTILDERPLLKNYPVEKFFGVRYKCF